VFVASFVGLNEPEKYGRIQADGRTRDGEWQIYNVCVLLSE